MQNDRAQAKSLRLMRHLAARYGILIPWNILILWNILKTFWFHKKLSDSVKHFDFVKHSENIFYSVKKLSDLWNILISWSILKIFWFCKKNFLICETFWFRETFWKHFDTVRKLWSREIIWFRETILLLMLLPIWNWYDQWSRLVAFLDLVILLKLELLTIPIK